MGSSPAPRHQRDGNGRVDAALPSGRNGGGNVIVLAATRVGVGQRDESGWGDGDGNVVALAATRACVGRRDKSGWGEEEHAVTMAAAILSCGGRALDDGTRGGGRTARGVVVATKDDD